MIWGEAPNCKHIRLYVYIIVTLFLLQVINLNMLILFRTSINYGYNVNGEEHKWPRTFFLWYQVTDGSEQTAESVFSHKIMQNTLKSRGSSPMRIGNFGGNRTGVGIWNW